MAQVDYFLKIKDVPGESTKDGHKDEIEIMSWSWGESNSGSHSANQGGGVGRAVLQDFAFTMTINKASPELFLACASGKNIPEALLTCRESGEKQLEYLKIKFNDLHISSYQTGGSEGSIKPTENITFNFAKIEISYAPQVDNQLKAPITKWYNARETTKG